MTHSMRFGIFLACLLVWRAQGDTNQFVKEKRTKKVSVARMKEDIGELLGHCLTHSTGIVEQMGKLQRELMQMMATLVEQSKESKLTQADRFSLDKTIDELSVIECDFAALAKRLSQHTEVVKKQY